MPHRTEPTPPCTGQWHVTPDCLAALADGSITASDLCSGCTTKLMVAVDWVTGRENTWHRNYAQRAAGEAR